MIEPGIFVTGATGKTGGAVATGLLRAGYRVRALVHREDGRSASLREQGAEVAITPGPAAGGPRGVRPVSVAG